MKSWENLEPDRYRLMNKHYSKGRNGRTIDKIVVHHNAGILSVDDIWQVWQSRQASAHYQVESGGLIGQLVNDWDTAWHAANTYINESSIGIEVSNYTGPPGWKITDKAVEEAAHLIAALCRAYKLGRPNPGTNIRYHREFTGTSCPHNLAPGGEDNATLISRARHWYDAMANPTNPAPAPAPAPAPKETEVTKDQADRIEAKLDLLLDQVAGQRNERGEQEFNGWEQGGHRTLYDLTSAIAADAGIAGTADTKKGRK
ncbi:peptidoglycan recognition protein family protein [Dietzia alimentaria]|uniref:peptidoglycan recognition protein family protein n=1 Tax=Dietzia alimentaria TaxID=665550 RepID=UPI00029ABF93|nr:peptidoglycan recognition family protein [Dietzia alimentaria]